MLESPFKLAQALLNMVGLRSLELRDIERMIPVEREKFLEVLFSRTREGLEELSFFGKVVPFFGDRYNPAGVLPRFRMLKRLELESSTEYEGEFFILMNLVT
jgi:hypothetical protein